MRAGDAWAPLVGQKLEEKVAAAARSHRAEVRQALAAYRATDAAERKAATEAEEQAPAEAAGAQDAHLSAEGSGTSSGEVAAARSEEAARVDEQRGSQEASKESGSAGEGGGFASQPSAPGPEPSVEASAEGGSSASEEVPSDEGSNVDGTLKPGTLVVDGTAIPYRDVRGGTTPSSGGGLWLGSDAVDDGSWGYFVGHNPGSFAPVRSLSSGDAVVVCDRSGGQRTYTVRDVFQVEETATWKTIASRVTGYGESVVLQTCAGDGMNVIVVAA
ncbi:sortase domain-bontaining protein [uncultured Adlercreutzia sp.]|uniref:sortase domain-containing protein n=1 Tax=uncultured Adlercreutzia sp. TaxID=875803 RepID=UPI00258EFC74|nr:sortase [uncultured Adlercreutzia sp.]